MLRRMTSLACTVLQSGLSNVTWLCYTNNDPVTQRSTEMRVSRDKVPSKNRKVAMFDRLKMKPEATNFVSQPAFSRLTKLFSRIYNRGTYKWIPLLPSIKINFPSDSCAACNIVILWDVHTGDFCLGLWTVGLCIAKPSNRMRYWYSRWKVWWMMEVWWGKEGGEDCHFESDHFKQKSQRQ